MNEKKKLYVILAAIAAIMVLIPTLVLVTNKKDQEYLDKIKEQMAQSNSTLLYIERPDCYFCDLLSPITTELKEEYGLNYYDINTNKISNSLLNKVLKLLDVKPADFGTPFLVAVKDGKIIGKQNGYANESTIFEFFKKNGMIGEQSTLWYTPITQEDFVASMSSSEKKYVFIGSDQVSESLSMKAVLKELAKTSDKQIYYIELGSEGVVGEIAAAFAMEVSEFTTPVFFSIENGTVTKAEANSKTAYENLLK